MHGEAAHHFNWEKIMWQQTLFILRLFVYSAISSAVIKYAAPTWGLLVNNLTVDVMNAIAISAIILPVSLFAFVLWLKR
jgi:hypothetical protein